MKQASTGAKQMCQGKRAHVRAMLVVVMVILTMDVVTLVTVRMMVFPILMQRLVLTSLVLILHAGQYPSLKYDKSCPVEP